MKFKVGDNVQEKFASGRKGLYGTVKSVGGNQIEVLIEGGDADGRRDYRGTVQSYTEGNLELQNALDPEKICEQFDKYRESGYSYADAITMTASKLGIPEGEVSKAEQRNGRKQYHRGEAQNAGNLEELRFKMKDAQRMIDQATNPTDMEKWEAQLKRLSDEYDKAKGAGFKNAGPVERDGYIITEDAADDYSIKDKSGKVLREGLHKDEIEFALKEVKMGYFNSLRTPEARRAQGKARYGREVQNTTYHIRPSDPEMTKDQARAKAESMFPLVEGDKVEVRMEGESWVFTYSKGQLTDVKVVGNDFLPGVSKKYKEQFARAEAAWKTMSKDERIKCLKATGSYSPGYGDEDGSISGMGGSAADVTCEWVVEHKLHEQIVDAHETKNELNYESPKMKKLFDMDNKIIKQYFGNDVPSNGGPKYEEYKKLVAANFGTITQEQADILEDQNYHTLYQALRELGKVVAGSRSNALPRGPEARQAAGKARYGSEVRNEQSEPLTICSRN